MSRERPLVPRPSDSKGIPKCLFHESVWASHKVVFTEGAVYVCKWCSEKRMFRGKDVRELKPLSQSGSEKVVPLRTTKDS